MFLVLTERGKSLKPLLILLGNSRVVEKSEFKMLRPLLQIDSCLISCFRPLLTGGGGGGGGGEGKSIASWLASLQLPHLVHLNCLDA